MSISSCVRAIVLVPSENKQNEIVSVEAEAIERAIFWCACAVLCSVVAFFIFGNLLITMGIFNAFVVLGFFHAESMMRKVVGKNNGCK